jgi:hypothetical protein
MGNGWSDAEANLNRARGSRNFGVARPAIIMVRLDAMSVGMCVVVPVMEIGKVRVAVS